ncbi:hypothetical protein BJX63DRAFT_442427 [Aspergillus granulosus]|uniref:Clr5 domain-containing protein n=1 Tax=Aspergillus granulosus TaxID=176169 RepID=A0ABR4HH08_9EURO
MSTLKDHWRVAKSSSNKTRTSIYRKPVPRQDSPHANNANNRTLYHPAQNDWTWENMPDIIYQLKPEGKSNRNEEPPYLSYRIHGRRVRDLPVLPDNISSTVEEFRVEAWMRLDRRIRLKDITDRIHPDFRLRENALQQRGVRFRQAFGLLAWDSGNKRSLDLEAKLLRKMELLGLDPNSNSTRGITPGLIDPKAGEAGGRVPVPAGWGPNKSPRCKKIQHIEAELLNEPMPKFNPSEPGSGVSKEPTPDPDPSGETHSFEEPHKPVVQSEYASEHTSYDGDKTHLNGDFSVIQGIIAEDTLPTSVRMADLDLPMGATLPDLDGQAPIWSSGSALSPHGFCSSTCFNNAPQQSGELLKSIQPSIRVQNKPQTPTTDLFQLINPAKLYMMPEPVAKNDFDCIVDEFYTGEPV